MLVLSRKSGESVCIGPEIEVKVLEICGGRVRLGFSAPLKVDIQRGEISSAPPNHCEQWCEREVADEFCGKV
jgi:carbon storage regulator